VRRALTSLALLWLGGACSFAAAPTGAWRLAAEPPLGTTGGSATVLSDGRVLLAGGYFRNGSPSPAAQLHDPSADGWTQLPSMPGPRMSHTATLLRDGRVLITGGSDGERSLSSTLIFDPSTLTWSPAAPLPSASEGASSVLLDDGRVLVVGGNRRQLFSPELVPLASAETYDPARSAWSTAPNLSVPTAGGRLVALGDGTALYAGGFGENGPVIAPELFDPVRNAWTSAGDLPLPISIGLAAPLGRQRVLFIGTGLGPSNHAAAVLFSLSARSWSVVKSPPGAAFPVALAPASAGRLLLIEIESQGGRQTVGGAFYDPHQGSWSSIATYEESGNPGNLDVAPLDRGRVLVAGEAAHIFDPDASAAVSVSSIDVIESPSLTLAEGILAVLLLAVLGVRALRSRLT
jgi:hypothetical protein